MYFFRPIMVLLQAVFQSPLLVLLTASPLLAVPPPKLYFVCTYTILPDTQAMNSQDYNILLHPSHLPRQVLSSCTGSQEPIQKTQQCSTAKQRFLKKGVQWLFPVCTGTPGHNPKTLVTSSEQKAFSFTKIL